MATSFLISTSSVSAYIGRCRFQAHKPSSICISTAKGLLTTTTLRQFLFSQHQLDHREQAVDK